MKKQKKPIEVSFIEKKKEKPVVKPIPPKPVYEEPVISDNKDIPEETTLEHDLRGGQRARNIQQKKYIEKTPDVKKRNIIKEEKIKAPEISKDSDKTKIIDKKETKPDYASIYDTKDIIKKIAEKKPESPEGEDTASYNVFQEKYESYFYKLRKRIYEIWRYPDEAKINFHQGTVTVSFSITKEGKFINIKMLRSSGYPELDREVMRVLKTIGQIPLPSSYKLNQLNVSEANFIYTIRTDFTNKYIE